MCQFRNIGISSYGWTPSIMEGRHVRRSSLLKNKSWIQFFTGTSNRSCRLLYNKNSRGGSLNSLIACMRPKTRIYFQPQESLPNSGLPTLSRVRSTNDPRRIRTTRHLASLINISLSRSSVESNTSANDRTKRRVVTTQNSSRLSNSQSFLAPAPDVIQHYSSLNICARFSLCRRNIILKYACSAEISFPSSTSPSLVRKEYLLTQANHSNYLRLSVLIVDLSAISIFVEMQICY